jgi:nucleotide-binding universal stress UspA family protein
MRTLRHILAATDFSPAARHACERASRLAHETGATLSLMHVLPDEPFEVLRRWLGAGHAVETCIDQAAQAQLVALAAQLRAERHVTARTSLVLGAVLDQLMRQADFDAADLLVLGTRGQGPLRRLALGSTAERLLRRTRRPLLLVRARPHEPYRRVMVALDFSPWSDQAVALARRVAPHAQLLLLTVYQVPFEEKLLFAGVDAATIAVYRDRARAEASQHLHEAAQRAGLKSAQWSAWVLEGDASLRILEQAEARDADLVVLGKHGLSAAEELLLGSVTKHVLAEGQTDVLVSTGTAS